MVPHSCENPAWHITYTGLAGFLSREMKNWAEFNLPAHCETTRVVTFSHKLDILRKNRDQRIFLLTFQRLPG